MGNINYQRSRVHELKLVNKYRDLGWFSTRTPGSKTPVDCLAIKPAKCGDGNHYEVLFHQFKVSENRVNEKSTIKVENIPFPANILWHYVPIKSLKWKAKRKIQRDKKAKS